MQAILQQAKGDPAALQEHMRNPQVRASVQKLIAAGVHEEDADASEDEPWDEVPQRGRDADDGEETVARDVLAFLPSPVAVQGVHQAAADERTRVDHARRPDEEGAEHSSHRHTDKLV